jgi:hypothetical protein
MPGVPHLEKKPLPGSPEAAAPDLRDCGGIHVPFKTIIGSPLRKLKCRLVFCQARLILPVSDRNSNMQIERAHGNRIASQSQSQRNN